MPNEETNATPVEIVESHPGADQNRLVLEWKAPEFIRPPKTPTWFMVAGILMLMLVAYALYTGSATMAIVFIVLAGVYYLTHSQQPRIISVKITQLGIYVEDQFYPYNMINAFWVVYHPPFVRTLNLRMGGKSGARLVVQLDDQNPVEVRTLLAKEVPEVEGQQETLTDILIRLLRL
jgi:hypothetical protein